MVRTETAQNTLPDHRTGFLRRLWNQRYVQAMALPGIIWLVIFAYLPMWGIIIAFKQYSLIRPLSAVPWVGFQFFIEFVTDEKFWPVLANTLGISVLRIGFGFPLPIIFALFLNEMTSNGLKRTVCVLSSRIPGFYRCSFPEITAGNSRVLPLAI